MKRYRIFCETDQKYEYFESDAPVAECPVDSLHTVRETSLTNVYPASERLIENFRIGQYANDFYKDCPFECFDFVRMLKINISTTKTVYDLPNGRPQKAEYRINNELVAIIYFTFVTDADNVVTSRKRELVYIDYDGNESERILIGEKASYDPGNQAINDGTEVMAERVLARSGIVEKMKANLAGIIMMALGQNMGQTVQTIKPFWDEYKTDRDNFIELGAEDWKDNLTALDLQTTPHTWLAIEVAPTFTVRDFIVDKLTY